MQFLSQFLFLCLSFSLTFSNFHFQNSTSNFLLQSAVNTTTSLFLASIFEIHFQIFFFDQQLVSTTTFLFLTSIFEILFLIFFFNQHLVSTTTLLFLNFYFQNSTFNFLLQSAVSTTTLLFLTSILEILFYFKFSSSISS